MPKTIHDELVEAIKARGVKSTEFNYGILTADRYLKTIEECVGHAACNRFASTRSMSFNDQLIKAANTLTYNNDEMLIEGNVIGEVEFATVSELEDVNGKKLELPKSCLMVFKHVLTSPKKDRDGDVLRTQGAKPDPKMLLLFNHTHTLPIGKMLGIAEHTSKRLVLYSSIIDMNELSHDSAVMVDNGMGRFSHGFRAIEFTEVKEDHSHGKPTSPGGFDIKSFEIMEESLVSVPSNTDAEVQEVLLSLVESRKLTSPLMKGYGKDIRSKRATSVSIPARFPIDLNITINGKSISSEKEEIENESTIIESKSTKCGCGQDRKESGSGDESSQSTSTETDAADTKGKPADDSQMMCPKCGAKMEGGICEKCGYGKTEKSVCPKCAGKITESTRCGKSATSTCENGHTVLSSDLVSPKSIKSGRVINAKNMANLIEAKTHVEELHNSEMLLTPKGKGKCRKAYELLEDVIKSANSEEGISPSVEQRDTEITVKEAMAIFVSKSDPVEQRRMIETLKAMQEITRRQKQTETFKKFNLN